jgi:hypothetical protein
MMMCHAVCFGSLGENKIGVAGAQALANCLEINTTLIGLK